MIGCEEPSGQAELGGGRGVVVEKKSSDEMEHRIEDWSRAAMDPPRPDPPTRLRTQP